MPKVKINIESLNELLNSYYSTSQSDIDRLQESAWIAKAEIEKSDNNKELIFEFADTNRPDLWSVEGFTRLINIYKKNNKKDYSKISTDININEANFFNKEKMIVNVEPSVNHSRPYIGMFFCKIPPISENFLKDLIQVQEKLADNYGSKRKLVSIGIYPYENIEFPLTYKAVSPDEISFIPLDFDKELNLQEILDQHPKGIEYAYTLENREKYPILVDNNNKVISFPPIINSKDFGEVKVGDELIIIEATGMNRRSVELVLTILAYNLYDRDGIIFQMDVVNARGIRFTHPILKMEEESVYLPHVYSLLGIEEGKEQIEDSLKRMGYFINRTTCNEIFVSIPPYRNDIMHEVDLIEDIIIAKGFNDIKPLILDEYTSGGHSIIQEKIEILREITIGLGFVEYMGNILSSYDYLKSISENFSDPVEIQNPMTTVHNCLRDYLFPGLLKLEAVNSKALYPHFVFEIGEVVKKEYNENILKTKTLNSLCVSLSYPDSSFSELHSYIENFSKYLQIPLVLSEKNYPFLIPGRAADICIDDNTIGFIGEVHPKTLDKLGIRMPTVFFEIKDISTLFK